MLRHLSHSKASGHVWIFRIALLCFIVFHAFGLFHSHATELEHSACVACQVAEHQALDVPQVGCATFTLMVSPCVLWLRKPCAVYYVEFLVRPQPRGPPSYQTS